MSRRTCSAVMLATRVHCHPLQKSTSNKFNTSSLTLTRFTTRKACVLRWTSIISQKRSLFSNSTNLTACSHLLICRLTNRTDKTFCRQEKIDRNTLLQSLLICIGRKSAKVFFALETFVAPIISTQKTSADCWMSVGACEQALRRCALVDIVGPTCPLRKGFVGRHVEPIC